MFRRDRMVHFVIEFLMCRHGISVIFAFEEQLGLPEIRQQNQMGIPIIDDAIEDGTEYVVFPYFFIKGVYQ